MYEPAWHSLPPSQAPFRHRNKREIRDKKRSIRAPGQEIPDNREIFTV